MRFKVGHTFIDILLVERGIQDGLNTVKEGVNVGWNKIQNLFDGYEQVLKKFAFSHVN